MSYWFITESLQRVNAGDAALLFPAQGLPDLTRALSRDHLREWVKQLHRGEPPERVDTETDYFWKLISELHPDDYVIAARDKDTLALGEITAAYRFEKDAEGGKHVWPVRWIATDIPLSSFEAMRPLLASRTMKEMASEDTRMQFRKYFPSWQMRGYMVFRWISIILLFAELVYFWPGK